jgi:hypothetical protein
MRFAPWAAVAAVLALAACTMQTAASSTPVSGVSRYQYGMDLDFYWHPDQNVARLVAADAAYARSLGANSVLIAFPLYTNGSTVAVGPETPPLWAVREAVAVARSVGLEVGVRPLLDDASLDTHSRTTFVPDNATKWLDSYQAPIVLYARAAQHSGATRFFVGAELSEFAHASSWRQVDQAVRAVFHGQLYFSANWATSKDTAQLAGSGGPGVTVAVDAYYAMPVPISQFTSDWAAQAAVLPRGTVMSEVNIAARQGAQRAPYVSAPEDAPLDSQLQAAWFTAACKAVKTDHLGGIYFWAISVGHPQFSVPPEPETANQITDSLGANAIKACFTSLGGFR